MNFDVLLTGLKLVLQVELLRFLQIDAEMALHVF
jgi:hypothetical protein